jgi:plasmid stabilization system protein ParE
MTEFKVRIHKGALQDIQEATDWYNKQVPGLGKRFQNQVRKQINALRITAKHYSIRYSDVRCILIKNFPFLIHFVLRDNQVEVFAVIHTSRNPKIWESKRNR